MPNESQGTPVELKMCELCGRSFVRPIDPGLRWDGGLGEWVQKTKQRDCAECILNPPVEDENVYVQRSFRLLGVKI